MQYFEGRKAMDRSVTTTIDRDKCIGCGLCVRVCPSRTLSMQGEKACVSGDKSLSCGHCAAVCPVDAVRVSAIVEDTSKFDTFQADGKWLPHGEFDTVQLVRLMGSRRSCRSFKDKPIDRIILEDLVKIGITAPSGSNSQLWTFTLLPSRRAILAFGEQIAIYFNKLNRLSEKKYLRTFLKLIGKGELDFYYREYHDSVKEALAEWDNAGADRLFHGATAVIVVGSKPGASCPAEDALLATQNILLAAHSMGFGSCLIGFAVEAMKSDISIKSALGIPDDEKVHTVIALGYPDETYCRIPGRKKYTQRYFE